ARRKLVACGEGGVRALGAAVGDLDRAKELLLEALGALLVELLKCLAQCGERQSELFDRGRYRVEQPLPRIGHGVRHRRRLFAHRMRGGGSTYARANRHPSRSPLRLRLGRASAFWLLAVTLA